MTGWDGTAEQMRGREAREGRQSKGSASQTTWSRAQHKPTEACREEECRPEWAIRRVLIRCARPPSMFAFPSVEVPFKIPTPHLHYVCPHLAEGILIRERRLALLICSALHRQRGRTERRLLDSNPCLQHSAVVAPFPLRLPSLSYPMKSTGVFSNLLFEISIVRSRCVWSVRSTRAGSC
jgi:hypothetical protein